jgi:HEXXH motif-containing protein
MRSNFVTLIKDALRDLGRCPWLPGLAAELARVGWRHMHDNFGISPSNYGTARILGRSSGAPREILTQLHVATGSECLNHVIQLEVLDSEFARGYEEAGVKFFTPDEIRELNVCAILKEAIDLLEFVPSLRNAVGSLVKSLHLIDAGDDSYDVSFSEPQLTFTIFVSVPHSRSTNAVLRVMESIIHEAMHLQLSLVERVIPLIRSEKNSYYSPWRNELRSARGVLHALYVFRVIDCLFDDLLTHHSLSSEHVEYVRDRRQQIREQISKVRDFTTSPELTQIGRTFVGRLVEVGEVVTV